MSKQSSIHDYSLGKTLDIIGVTFEEFTEVVLGAKSVDPVEILYSILDKKAQDADLNEDQIDAAKKVLDASLTFDHSTGTYDRKHRPMIEAAGDIIAANTDTEVYKVQIDISNMGGANEAVGRKNVDDVIRIFTELYENALRETSSVVSSRDGGDEIGFVTVGGNREDIEKAINNAQNKIEDFVKEAGLETLVHLKYPDVDARRGFSAGAGYAPLGIGLDKENIQMAIDTGVEYEKIVGGQKRHKESIAEFEQSNNSRFLPSDFHENETNDVNEKERRKGNLQKVEKTIEKYKDDLLISFHEVRKTQSWSEDLFPIPANKEILTENPETLRIESIINKAEELDLSIEQVSLFVELTKLYDERDPLTGLKMSRDFINDIDRFNNSEKESILTIIEIENLSGLNEEKGHYASDCAIAKTSDLLKEKITDEYGENQTNNMYHTGAGRIAIILPVDATTSNDIDREQEKLQNIIASAAKIYDDEVNISDVAEIKHPKKDNNIIGTGLEYVTILLESDKSAEYHMRDIDIIRKYDGNKGLKNNEIAEEAKKDNVDRKTIEATWTIASRGETRGIERSTHQDEKGAEEKAGKAEEKAVGGIKDFESETRRKRPRLKGGYAESYKNEKSKNDNNPSK